MFSKITPLVQFITATIAVALALYGAGEKFGWWERKILEWAPEHFKINAEQITDPITVTVARIKKRDDCSVESFTTEIQDSRKFIHDATPSNQKFSGPASPEIDTFTYDLIIAKPQALAKGTATLLAQIKYKCPEGERVVTYPRHNNLTFTVR